jgi:hypothetical protein
MNSVWVKPQQLPLFLLGVKNIQISIFMSFIKKSNKGSGKCLPLQNIFNYQNSEKFVYDDKEKCVFLNKYFRFISKSRNRIDKHNNIADLNVSVKEISDVIQIL